MRKAELPRKLRVLCVGRDLQGGGAERVQTVLLREIDRRKIDVTLAYMSDFGELRAELPAHLTPHFGDFRRLPVPLAAVGLLNRLVRLARRHDLMFAMQEGTPIYLSAIAGSLAGRPVLGWLHSMWSELILDVSRWHCCASDTLYPRTARMVCVSEEVASDLISRLPAMDSRVKVLPNPLDISRILRDAKGETPAWADEVFSRKTIVGCGRLARHKRFDLLIEAFALLRRRGCDYNLLILGEGDCRVRLEALIEKLGLSDRVFLPGFLPNPYPVMHRADLFALTSQFEGLGMVVLEALALKVPVVAFDCKGGGPREILQNRNCGQLVDAGDVNQLSEMMDRILCDDALAEDMRRQGVGRAADYESRHVTRQFEELFFDVAWNAHSS